MFESQYSSFLNSEPALDLSELDLSEVGEGESECSMDMATDTGDLDGTLFASLLDNKNIDDDNSSASDSDDMCDYLDGRKTSNLTLSKGSSLISNKIKYENQWAVDHEIDVINVSEGESSSVSSDSKSGVSLQGDTNRYITLYAKDLPRESSGDQPKSRSRKPLMSSVRSGPSLVVSLPRIDSKFPVPLKYQKEHSHRHEDSNLDTKMSPSKFQKENCDETRSSKSNSKTKNAILARKIRERKKKYVKNLEDSVEVLKTEKDAIKTKYIQQCSHVKYLEKEVQYLRNVIANQSTISALLNNVHKTPGIAITTSLKCSKKRKSLDENDNQEITANGIYVRASPRNKKVKKQNDNEIEDVLPSTDNEIEDVPPSTLPEESSGVCLHVANKHVSLEFCSQCASSASGAWKRQAKSEACMPLKAAKAELANKITRNRC